MQMRRAHCAIDALRIVTDEEYRVHSPDQGQWEVQVKNMAGKWEALDEDQIQHIVGDFYNRVETDMTDILEYYDSKIKEVMA